jgi:hypothetical protein
MNIISRNGCIIITCGKCILSFKEIIANIGEPSLFECFSMAQFGCHLPSLINNKHYAHSRMWVGKATKAVLQKEKV